MIKYVIGLDYGTNSCRAVLMKIGSAIETAQSVFPYPSGEQGIILEGTDPHVARQHPKDYVDGMVNNIKNVLNEAKDKVAGFDPAQVVGLGFATTGSTVIPVDETCTPLAFKDGFKNNKNALAWLWKDHTSSEEAAQITELASKIRPQYMERCGGTYSSEWFWAKVLHLKNIDPVTFDAAYSYIELCDYLPAVLAGITDPTAVKRGVCAAGHKAMYSESWGGLPDKEFLTKLNPALADLRDRLYKKAYTSDVSAGTINSEWAERTGLAEGTVVAVGAFDAHMGAVGAAVAEGRLIKIMGTSTCDLMISENDQVIKGVCGTVNGSVLPGYVGIEAGQSAVGDLFLWLTNHLVPESYGKDQGEVFKNLTAQAGELKAGQSGLLSLDWNNGNRCVLTDMDLSGLLIGQTLHTKPHEIYRALIEATAFGALKIINRLEESGAPVSEIICCGGLAQKNALMMQIYANVTNRKIRVAGTDLTCAIGAGIFAAAAADAGQISDLQKKMTHLSDTVYTPDTNEAAIYKKLYSLYDELHDSFGVKGTQANLFHVMKDLHRIRKEAVNA